MKPFSKDDDWYPRLVTWTNWEIPKPGREGLAGFAIMLAISALLHGSVVWLCSWFQHR